MERYLTEAFQELKVLEEETFNVSADGTAELNQFISTEEEEMETVIDPLADTEEDLEDSYLGKVIVDCIICNSKIYKDPTEITVNSEETLVNVGEICPYCQSSDGYEIIGQVAEFSPSEETEEVVSEEKPEENIDVSVEPKEDIEESIRSAKGMKKLKSMKENIENVEVETENEIITVSSESKEEEVEETSEDNTVGEVIAPLSDEIEDQLERESEADEFEEIEIEEFDEEEFDSLGEKYLKKVYENVSSYKTVSGKLKGNSLKFEGIITFKSGKKAKTNFIFEAKSVSKTGKLKFVGENKQFATGKTAFILSGKRKGNKLISESLTYNYRGKDARTGESKRLYGRVSI